MRELQCEGLQLSVEPRFFISSVIEGYSEYRDAAASGVAAAGARPLRVEDVPSRSASSRNACLDLVEQSDAYLVIVGPRGGWTTPSGLTATEEEYQHAKLRGKPILGFLQRAPRDADAQRLADKLSDYVEGRFRRTFHTPEELRSEVEKAVRETLPSFSMKERDPATLEEVLRRGLQNAHEAYLRAAFAPERDQPLVDVLDFDNREFQEQLYEVLHRKEVRFFDWEQRKRPITTRSTLRVTEEGEHSGRFAAAVEITASGILLLETTVTGRTLRGKPHDLTNHMEVLEDEVVDAGRRLLAAASGVLDAVDPHVRFERLLMNGCLANLGYRKWAKTGARKDSYGMRMSDSKEVFAFDAPSIVTRPELRNPSELLNRMVALLRRNVEFDS